MSVGCFLKFGRREHLEYLAQGKLHFSSVRALRDREAKLQKGVGDKHEGGIEMANARFRAKNYLGQTTEDTYKIDLVFEPLDEVPVFCITACAEDECTRNEDGTISLSVKAERLEWFRTHFDGYDSVAVIKEPDVFINDLLKSFQGHVMHREVVYQDKEFKVGGRNPIEILIKLASKGEEMLPGVPYTADYDDILNILFFKDTFFELEHEYRFVLNDEKEKVEESRDYPIIMNSTVCIYSIEELLSGNDITC